MKNELSKIHLLHKVTPIIIAILIVVLLIWFIPSKFFPVTWDFRNNLWGPANLLIHQRSPYNIHVIFESSNAVWMPIIIGIFFPLGYLPSQWASNLWLLLNIISLCLIVVLLARNSHKSIIWILLTLFSLAIFPSTLSHFVLGQISLIICLILYILVNYRNQLKPIIIGLFLAFSFTKPQLIVLFLPVYLVVYLREQRQKLSSVIMYMIIWIVVFCLPLFLFFPNWVPDFFLNLSNNPPWFYPSLYSFLLSSSGSLGMSLATAWIWFIIGISIGILLTFKLDSVEALLWCLAITPLFSPVVWSWDFVLLYPLIIFMVFQKKSRVSSWVLYCSYGICTIAFIFMKIYGLVDDQMTFWVPPFLITALLLSRTLQRKIFRESNLIQNE